MMRWTLAIGVCVLVSAGFSPLRPQSTQRTNKSILRDLCELCGEDLRSSESAPRSLSRAEGAMIDLFDGKTTAGWRGFREQTMPAAWQVVDGALTRVDKGSDIVTTREFADFDLTVEWKIAPRANSGIFYRVTEEEPQMWMCAPEYQVIDDRGYPEPLKPVQKTGANYDLQPPVGDATRPAGAWNTTRILVDGSHVEHWLNGVKVVEYEL